MKKLLLITLILLGLIISGGAVSAKQELGKGAYVNENGVKIFKKDYEKLVTLGFSDQEIIYFTQQEYDLYTKKHIDYVKKQKFFIETKTTEVNGEVLTTQNLLDEKQFYQKYHEYVESTEAESSRLASVASLSPKSNSNSTFAKNALETTTTTSGFMVLTLTATYDGCKGLNGEIFVKANLEWTSVPTQRYDDLLAITFSNNLYLKRSEVYGGNKPDFQTKFFYTAHTLTFNPLILGYDESYEQRHMIFTPDSTDYYKEASNYLISRVPLPLDDNLHLFYKQGYMNFFITTQCTLVPTSSNYSQVIIGSVYAHQYGFGYFEWDRVNFYLNSPYFTYTSSILVNTPAYVNPVAGVVQLNNLTSGHQFYVSYYNTTYHTYRCSECGFTYQEDHNMVDGHCTGCDYHEHVHTFRYNSTATGHTGTCTTCGVVVMDLHTLVWTCNDKQHWQYCTVCGYETKKMKHMFLDNGGTTCAECGAHR